MDPSDRDLALKRYRETEHVVLEGTLATIPIHVVITPYAQGRMKTRDIDESELLEVLALPRSSHGRGKNEGRCEVAGKTFRGHLRVVYELPMPEIVLIITTHLESV